jgi:hypothetical protein
VVKTVDTIVRVNNADAAAVQDAVKARLTDIFSKVKSTAGKKNQVHYKGGSFFQPYGFKATASTETIGDATVLKLSGRPAMNFISYLAALVVAGFLIYGLNFGASGIFGVIAAVIMIIASKAEQKKVTRRLQQVTADISSVLQ